MIPVHAVITTHNRPDDLRDCVAAIAPQVHHVVVIDNASTPPVQVTNDYALISDPEQPPNLSRLWNVGIEWSAEWASFNHASLWDTLILNDDFIAGDGFVDALQTSMRDCDAVISSPFVYGNRLGHRVDYYDTPGTLTDLGTRMAGFAWMMRGEARLRCDESIKWWYGDDDIAQQACSLTARVVVHGLKWGHRHPDGSTRSRPDLTQQAGRDRQTFVDKWGWQPW